jgi:hypothetical protein
MRMESGRRVSEPGEDVRFWELCEELVDGFCGYDLTHGFGVFWRERCQIILLSCAWDVKFDGDLHEPFCSMLISICSRKGKERRRTRLWRKLKTGCEGEPTLRSCQSHCCRDEWRIARLRLSRKSGNNTTAMKFAQERLLVRDSSRLRGANLL